MRPIEWCYFEWPWMTKNPDLTVTPLTLNIWETVRDRDIVTMEYYNRDLHVPYWRISFRMTLSDLDNYSVTRSIARPVCDSWASCSYLWVVTYITQNTNLLSSISRHVLSINRHACLWQKKTSMDVNNGNARLEIRWHCNVEGIATFN